jgi:hypothetical protein
MSTLNFTIVKFLMIENLALSDVTRCAVGLISRHLCELDESLSLGEQ